MFNLIQRSWRVLATGFAFACFFLGGAVLAGIVFPVLAIREVGREDRTQRLISRTFRFYLAMLRVLGLIGLEIVNGEQLATCQGKIIVANHPTLLDVVFLMAMTPRVCCIVKHELWDNRYLKGVVRAAGYIRNDLPPDLTIEACRRALDQGNNLIIFPEGTRSRIGEPLRFHRGVANIAMLTRTSIQLVVISCNPLTLTKGEPWYRVPSRRPWFRLEIAHRMDIERFMAYSHRGLGARRLMMELREFYSGRLANG
ncbi:MAG: lysophospholipid acyltransferase family protein [Acetobacteraceae bacterium]|jgi:1-acyl-sn-glycerol-3-phosphate acyltransferase